MSINQNNYVGANTTLVGYVAVDPRNPKYDPEGKRGIKQIPIAINEGYRPRDGGEFVKTGVTWYDVEVTDEFLENNPVGKSDKIRVDNAKQEIREYGDEGNKKLGITLKFGQVTVLESKSGGNDYSDDTPY